MKYFDHNATTPMDPSTVECWSEASTLSWFNPSSPGRRSARVSAQLAQARKDLAAYLGADPEHLVFCSGSTEACNIWVDSFFRFNKTQKLLASTHEHSCMRRPLLMHESRVKWFNPLDLSNFDRLADELYRADELGAVAMIAASNETGVCYPWQKVAKKCAERGIPFFSDMTQWIGKMPLFDLCEVSGLCGSAHKFGGPKGVGFIKTHPRFFAVQGIRGGQQESGVRAGTENYPGIASMLHALNKTASLSEDSAQTSLRYEIRAGFIDEVKHSIPEIIPVGEHLQALWNTVNLIMPIQPNHWWIEQLETTGFEISSGSACQSSSGEASMVLKVMGYSTDKVDRGIRISSGWETTAEDWSALAQALISVYRKALASSTDNHVISLDDL
jgi:cysteine desulfurase